MFQKVVVCAPPRKLVEIVRMPIAADDLAVVYDLARPLEPARQSAYVAAVRQRLEASAVVGPGQTHRIARDLQRQYYDPPQDIRLGEAASRRGIGGPRRT
jgi:hypothetical protein